MNQPLVISIIIIVFSIVAMIFAYGWKDGGIKAGIILLLLFFYVVTVRFLGDIGKNIFAGILVASAIGFSIFNRKNDNK